MALISFKEALERNGEPADWVWMGRSLVVMRAVVRNSGIYKSPEERPE